jgi:hypothetical protein
MTIQLPEAKLPSLQLPSIRSIPTIPGVGCVPADGSYYVGEQFGNLPDMQMLQHIKQMKKLLNEQIEALVEGYLPTAARTPLWTARVARLTQYVADLTAAFNTSVSSVAGEINATMEFVNGKKSELQGALNEINSIAPASRTAAQKVLAGRYVEYLGELDAQASRLQQTISCLTG